MNPKEYTNHSGGAEGADMKWDEIGRKYGVTEHVHWRPEDLNLLPEDKMKQLRNDVRNAAIALRRPWQGYRGHQLVWRNWLQVRYSDAIYAVAYIVPPGGTDYQGYTNETGKEIVAGGTAWAVEMAIQKGKPVYVFDMYRAAWFFWTDKFHPLYDTPTLTKNFAGVGSRMLTPEGIQAIEDVYIKTFNHAKEDNGSEAHCSSEEKEEKDSSS